MRRLLTIVLCWIACAVPAPAQVDTAVVARALAMVDEYVRALEPESLETKAAECDFLIGTCVDSLLRQAVAVELYDHFVDSQLMGDEAVAIHLYDRWFADGGVRFPSADQAFQARIFAEFNRSSLPGLPAPVLEMRDREDAPVTVPEKSGRRSILYFYDTDCAKCRMESILLRSWLEEQQARLDFYAIYTGSDREAWLSYVAGRLDVESDCVCVIHCWDPEAESDFPRLYGILQTPRLFLVDRAGVILGRRLTFEALRQLVDIGSLDEELYDRNPVGARLPSIRVEGVLQRPCGSAVRTRDLSRLRGRPAYLVFHSPGCARCQAELPALEASLKPGAKAFLVDVDRTLAEQPELARRLFDAFDLSVMPHIIAVDRRGRITERYVTFVGRE